LIVVAPVPTEQIEIMNTRFVPVVKTFRNQPSIIETQVEVRANVLGVRCFNGPFFLSAILVVRASKRRFSVVVPYTIRAVEVPVISIISVSETYIAVGVKL